MQITTLTAKLTQPTQAAGLLVLEVLEHTIQTTTTRLMTFLSALHNAQTAKTTTTTASLTMALPDALKDLTKAAPLPLTTTNPPQTPAANAWTQTQAMTNSNMGNALAQAEQHKETSAQPQAATTMSDNTTALLKLLHPALMQDLPIMDYAIALPHSAARENASQQHARQDHAMIK